MSQLTIKQTLRRKLANSLQIQTSQFLESKGSKVTSTKNKKKGSQNKNKKRSQRSETGCLIPVYSNKFPVFLSRILPNLSGSQKERVKNLIALIRAGCKNIPKFRNILFKCLLFQGMSQFVNSDQFENLIRNSTKSDEFGKQMGLKYLRKLREIITQPPQKFTNWVDRPKKYRTKNRNYQQTQQIQQQTQRLTPPILQQDDLQCSVQIPPERNQEFPTQSLADLLNDLSWQRLPQEQDPNAELFQPFWQLPQLFNEDQDD